MKIIDEAGAVIENPDLTLGYLVNDTEPLEHPAVEGVEEVSHYETVAEYPNGGRDVRKVIDTPGVAAKAAWIEQVPIQRYVRYTAEELAAQEEARKKQEAKDQLPETVAALQEDNKTLKKENEMLKQCLLEMSEIVYA
nr:MAG TPA: Transcription factor HY5 leucine zipper, TRANSCRIPTION.0A [Caudoviricetes sp.]